MKRIALLTGMFCAAAAVAVPAAEATFPGANGRIAYTWSRGGDGFETAPHPRLVGIFSVRADGRARRLVARGARAPRYSPSGRSIAFSRSRRVWVARADGTRARPVTPRGWPIAAGDYVWSPRGTRLAFVRGFGRATVREALHTVRPDGSGLRLLLKAPQGIAIRPGAWSPDGRAIVYAHARTAGPSLVRIHRGGRVTTLARGGDPTWSGRGLVAYMAPGSARGPSRVCTLPGRGGSPRCIGFANAAVSDPSWSPDGRRLMVMYTPQAGGAAEIWTVRPDGTVLSRAPRGDVFPIFSPNGALLAFSAPRFGGTPRLGYTDLRVMRLDGTGARRLVRGGQAQDPDWQPVARR
jgi:Tol biopolymer transport system component